MKQVTLSIPESKYAFFMQLMASLSFVELADSSQSYPEEFVDKIKRARKEHKDGNFISVEKENFKSFLGIE